MGYDRQRMIKTNQYMVRESPDCPHKLPNIASGLVGTKRTGVRYYGALGSMCAKHSAKNGQCGTTTA